MEILIWSHAPPSLPLLQLVQTVVVMLMHERSHNDPLRNLWPINPQTRR